MGPANSRGLSIGRVCVCCSCEDQRYRASVLRFADPPVLDALILFRRSFVGKLVSSTRNAALHASAIVTGNGITAFAGHSGAGKSTTAALLDSLGYELVTDDIPPVRFNQHSFPGAWPYLRRLKLRHDAIMQLAFTPTEIVSETLDKEKYFVPPKRGADDKWRRLERLYLLEKGQRLVKRFIWHYTPKHGSSWPSLRSPSSPANVSTVVSPTAKPSPSKPRHGKNSGTNITPKRDGSSQPPMHASSSGHCIQLFR